MLKSHKHHRKVRTSMTSKGDVTSKASGTVRKRNAVKRWKPDPIIDVEDYSTEEADLDFLFDTDRTDS